MENQSFIPLPERRGILHRGPPCTLPQRAEHMPPPQAAVAMGRKVGASQERASRGNRGPGQWEPPPGRGQRFHSSSQDERLRVVLGSISSLKKMSPLIQLCRTPATAQDSQPRELLPDPPSPEPWRAAAFGIKNTGVNAKPA